MADGQLYEMTIHATGEVRDKDGNLVSSEPLEAKTVVTEEQMHALTQGDPS
jgi:hypothetical protein